MLGYQTRRLVVDAHERDNVAPSLTAKGCSAAAAPMKQAAYVALRAVLHDGRLDLPPNARLRQQLRDVMAKPMPGGGVNITSPARPDGSHGDLVSALVNAAWGATHRTAPPSTGRVAGL